ncbi:MAG: 6,7-dimethyl-8-ribityllumazine synthase [Vicinamibacterales bacterium]
MSRGLSVKHAGASGHTAASGCRFGIVVSRFNPAITEGLLAGAGEALRAAGVSDDDVVVLRVPGAFEIPQAALAVARGGDIDAVICLGCLIKGDTMHFEYIASAATEGIMRAAIDTGVPMTLGVLTTLTEAQAVARSAPGPDNKGREAAVAAIEMVHVLGRTRESR